MSRHIEKMISATAAHQEGHMVEKTKEEQARINVVKSRGRKKKKGTFLIADVSHPELN